MAHDHSAPTASNPYCGWDADCAIRSPHRHLYNNGFPVVDMHPRLKAFCLRLPGWNTETYVIRAVDFESAKRILVARLAGTDGSLILGGAVFPEVAMLLVAHNIAQEVR
jgi:hypothetical protein